MVEQAPSGIALFFAGAFLLAAVVVFFTAEEGASPLSLVLGIAFVALGGAFVWLVGYGGGEQEVNLPEVTARAASVETTSEETTSTPEQTVQQTASVADERTYCLEKQFAEATQNLSPAQANDYESAIISEAVARGVDPRTVLTERGFPC
jgi:cytoskeletal protein RodZ